MQTRQLGNSDLHITPIGFGAWAIGGGGWAFGWGPQDDADSVAAIREALDLGINWIDTAAVYGLGHSEEVVAQALEGVAAKRPYVFTKCERVWDENRQIGKPLKADSHPPRVRGQPAAAQGRRDRPVPDPLAGAGRGHRGGLADAGEAEGGGQGPLDRRVELQRRSRWPRAAPIAPDHVAPAAVLAGPTARSRRSILPYCLREQHRRDRVLADGDRAC